MPPCFGTPVLHWLVAVIKHARRTELQGLSIYLGRIHDSRATESSICQSEGNAAKKVVEHLTGVSDSKRIGQAFPVYGNPEGPFRGIQIPGVLSEIRRKLTRIGA